MWTTESVLKKHNLWRELAGPDAGATAIVLRFQDNALAAKDARIAELEGLLREWVVRSERYSFLLADTQKALASGDASEVKL